MTAQSEFQSRPGLFARQPLLAGLGVFYLIALVPTLIAAASDPRMLDGAEVWVKPAKFLLSLAVYCLTTAWFFGYVDESRRKGPTARLVAWTIVIASLFEIAYIALQASRGERSHFNNSDVLHIVMYAVMGLGALALIFASLPLAWLIARRAQADLAPAYRDAVVLGLVLTVVLGGGFGGYMSAQMSHWVGSPPATSGLPVLGWSTTGGDLRPAHFVGMHAEQVLPFLALLIPGRGPSARIAVWALALAYAAFNVWVFARALAGLPLIGA